MNGRILELAKNPELFQIKDLELISNEIRKNPYTQSLRALHLLGTHRLLPENYTNELSVTAAYTTDKKILYQLINSPSKKEFEQQNIEVEKETDAEAATEIIEETPITKFIKVKSDPVEAPKAVYVNGELNRILFEGEEDFLERETEIIDLESTIESGQIVIQKSAKQIESAANIEEIQNLTNDTEADNLFKEEIIKENPGVEDQSIAERAEEIEQAEDKEEEDSETKRNDTEKFAETPDAENFSKEKIVEVNRIEDEKDLIEKPTNISFHQVEEFLPDVKVEAESEKSNDDDSKFAESPDAENFSKEKIVEVNRIEDEKDIVEKPTDVSFHHVEEFLPDVKVEAESEKSNDDDSKFAESPDAENFSKEKIIDEDDISLEEEVIENSAEVSFHATADFLPEVKIAPVKIQNELQQPPKQTFNKHEEEMNRLIAEVEAKMKASKKTAAKEEDISLKSAEVNFSETQHFDLSKAEEKSVENVEMTPQTKEELPKNEVEEEVEKPLEIEADKIQIKESTPEEQKTEWKPMSFSANTPDALIPKKTEQSSLEDQKVEKVDGRSDDRKEEVKSTERPAFNASFFTQNVSPLTKENEDKNNKTEVNIVEEAADSNVPTFINTWQNWLKIDRSKELTNDKAGISITEIKNKVIENFIEKEPKISKLKEESDFVIKERNDDISHLMTETLANLYIEQKLYSKAIKAFGLLSEKHPSKETYFKDKIKKIKELRQNK